MVPNETTQQPLIPYATRQAWKISRSRGPTRKGRDVTKTPATNQNSSRPWHRLYIENQIFSAKKRGREWLYCFRYFWLYSVSGDRWTPNSAPVSVGSRAVHTRHKPRLPWSGPAYTATRQHFVSHRRTPKQFFRSNVVLVVSLESYSLVWRTSSAVNSVTKIDSNESLKNDVRQPTPPSISPKPRILFHKNFYWPKNLDQRYVRVF